MRFVILLVFLLLAGAGVAWADPYFNSTECPQNPDGSPVNPNHLLCDDFQDGVWYSTNNDTFPALDDGWAGALGSGISPPGAAVCGPGVAAFGNCAATGGPQPSDGGGCGPVGFSAHPGPCAGSMNIAHHYLYTGTAASGCHASNGIDSSCTVNEVYVRVYARWDFTTFGNTKWLTITNDDGDLAFPTLFANSGGTDFGGTTDGQLTIGVNYCNPPPSTSGCNGANQVTWESQGLNSITLLRNHVYFVEWHVVTDAKTGVFGSGSVDLWANDCGTVLPLPTGACGAAPILRKHIVAPVPGNPNGQLISNIHFDFWTGFQNVGNGPYMNQLVVSRTGPIGFFGAVTVPPPTAPSNLSVTTP